jgi:hypothetical protein
MENKLFTIQKQRKTKKNQVIQKKRLHEKLKKKITCHFYDFKYDRSSVLDFRNII